MAEQNARIFELPSLAALPAGGLIPVWDPVQGLTGSLDLSLLLPSSPSFPWVSNNPPGYATGQVVTYGGKIWESLVDDNLGNVPIEGGGFWTEQSKSPSGLVSWQAGNFTDEETVVLSPKDQLAALGVYGMFRLIAATRPYNSVNLYTEWALGDWELVNNAKFIAVYDAATELLAGTVMTFKGGVWAIAEPGDIELGIVIFSQEDQFYVVELFTLRTRALAGLTPGDIYYAQADGTISAVVSAFPIFIAVSEETGVVLPDLRYAQVPADVTADIAANAITIDCAHKAETEKKMIVDDDLDISWTDLKEGGIIYLQVERTTDGPINLNFNGAANEDCYIFGNEEVVIDSITPLVLDGHAGAPQNRRFYAITIEARLDITGAALIYAVRFDDSGSLEIA